MEVEDKVVAEGALVEIPVGASVVSKLVGPAAGLVTKVATVVALITEAGPITEASGYHDSTYYRSSGGGGGDCCEWWQYL